MTLKYEQVQSIDGSYTKSICEQQSFWFLSNNLFFQQRCKSRRVKVQVQQQKEANRREALSLTDASWLSLLGQRLLERSDEVLSAAFSGFECVHSSRVVRVRHVMGIQGGGNVCCSKGILSFHLLLPFEKHRSVCFEVYLHFYIVHCSLYCHVHIDPKDEFNNI